MRRLVCASIVGVITVAAALPTLGQPAEGVTASAMPATRLYVRTLPPGAEVTVDGESVGRSDGLFLVPAGTARVSVQFEGRPPAVREVEIPEGRITRVEIAIAAGPIQGQIQSQTQGQSQSQVADADQATDVLPIPELRSTRSLAGPPAPLTRFDEALARPVDFAFTDIPLREAVLEIGRKGSIAVSIDAPALANAGVDADAPVTVAVAGLPLAIGLDIVCRPAGLAWTVEDDGLRITTSDALHGREVAHVYDVSDLWGEPTPTGSDSPQARALVDTIQTAIASDTWEDNGGRGTIRPDVSDAGRFLVVSQSLAVHRKIQGLLDCLRRLKATPPEQRSPLAADGYWSTGESAARARTALGTTLGSVSFDERPLREAVREVATLAGVPIVIDERTVENAGVDLDVPVSLVTTSLPLGKLLERLLEPHGLAVVVMDDRITVTSPGDTSEELSTAVYPVHRLVGSGRQSRSFQSLIDLILATVAPDTWETVGGSATVQGIAGDAPCLVIRQTTAGHRAVDAFLRSLR
jgi:hypothetical protein